MSDYLETIGNGTTFGTVKKEQNEYLYVVFRTHYFVSKPIVFDTCQVLRNYLLAGFRKYCY